MVKIFFINNTTVWYFKILKTRQLCNLGLHLDSTGTEAFNEERKREDGKDVQYTRSASTYTITYFTLLF